MNAQKNKALLRLLRLLTEPEKKAFRVELGVPENASDKDILESIGRLSQYEAVRAFLRAADSTLVLLRDVFEILDGFGIATKTTGCVFVLANPSKPGKRTELAFSQQTIGAVCTWSPNKKWSQFSESLSGLRSTWIRFRPAWQSLLQYAEPESKRGRIDVVRTHIQQRMTYGPDRYDIDEDAQRVLRHFTDRISHVAIRLREIPDEKRPDDLAAILRDIRELQKAVADCLNKPWGQNCSSRNETPAPPDERVIQRYISRQFIEDFDKFAEDVYLLSDLIRGEDLIDMLQIDIWSARPQLFEVWVLLSLLRWLQGRGYAIKFLQTEIASARPFRWNLSYAKDSKPCALVQHRDGSKQFLFYQLYRPSGDMPDISLLEDSDPFSRAVWSIDPKHSEKGGYSRREYEATAKRYRDSFGARLSLIVEYFQRLELGELNPTEFGSCAKLIRDCRPNGTGLPILFSELAQFHPPQEKVLVCIDCSSSFSSMRLTVLELFRGSLAKDDRVFSRECVCFAGNALIVSGFDKFMSCENYLAMFPSDLRSGTAAEPLLAALVEARKRIALSEIVLVTDGAFDIPVESVINRIESNLHIKATVFDPCIGLIDTM